MSENESITVKKIVVDWLKANGYDGLYNEEGPCGCILDDLICCADSGIEQCEAGHRIDGDNEDGFGYLMYPGKAKEENCL